MQSISIINSTVFLWSIEAVFILWAGILMGQMVVISKKFATTEFCIEKNKHVKACKLGVVVALGSSVLACALIDAVIKSLFATQMKDMSMDALYHVLVQFLVLLFAINVWVGCMGGIGWISADQYTKHLKEQRSDRARAVREQATLSHWIAQNASKTKSQETSKNSKSTGRL